MTETQTDIVDRLRAENTDPRNWRRMYGEAADEIERLRAALANVHAVRASAKPVHETAKIAQAVAAIRARDEQQ
jgi:hypothetical protein